MGSPQIGPGKAARFESHARDEGRFRVTGDPADLYAFRTPSLRSVALTAPYGHAGGHRDLRSFIEAHLDPIAALENYDLSNAILPALPVDDTRGLADTPAIAQVVNISPRKITDEHVTALIAFLDALTDPAAIEGKLGIPETVPSGLPIDHP
jgi:cytochrome c peroxidase